MISISEVPADMVVSFTLYRVCVVETGCKGILQDAERRTRKRRKLL